jgi:peptide/nickel transport system substrate-binding protein
MSDGERTPDITPGLTRRQILRIAAAGVATLAAGSVGARSAAAQAGGTVRINMATDIQLLDPHLVTAWNDYCPWECIFSSLTGLDRDFQPVPDLATSWTQPDPTTYVFALRRGVLFHNGREMKAADVKFSYGGSWISAGRASGTPSCWTSSEWTCSTTTGCACR